MPFPAALLLDKPRDFDDLVAKSCPQAGELKLITKDHATSKGAPGIVIAFEAMIGNNKIPVCATLPLESFMGIQKVIHSYYALRSRS